jgi:hypothetical protein
LLARVYSEAFGDKEQEEANANLIAAAPDLLAAAVAFMDEEGNCKEVRDMFRAAIAKSTGSTS